MKFGAPLVQNKIAILGHCFRGLSTGSGSRKSSGFWRSHISMEPSPPEIGPQPKIDASILCSIWLGRSRCVATKCFEFYRRNDKRPKPIGKFIVMDMQNMPLRLSVLIYENLGSSMMKKPISAQKYPLIIFLWRFLNKRNHMLFSNFASWWPVGPS